ncbi:MAG: histidine phosphatase family protein [Vicingaceae bacterium]
MKELYIIRHAKSSWDDDSLSDYDRPLNERGKNDAPLMGKVIRENGFLPDLIISSSANRAISTAKAIAQEVEFPTDKIVEERKIYESSTDKVIEIINKINDQFNRVFIVGHNPTFTHLIEALGGEYIGHLPTCGLAAIRFEVASWQMITADSGTQFYFDFPKRHK